nr:1-deoxy-D-xylulose-5-phosphate synthase [Zoogloeaceae bacterium]
GAFDISFLACIPNLVIMCPADENECRQMLYTAYLHDGPTAVRYPRGSGPAVTPRDEMSALPVGKAVLERTGKTIALLSFGGLLASALEVGEALDATVVNMRFVKPLDADIVLRLAETHDLLVTLEENALIGGAGSEVSRTIEGLAKRPQLLRLGLPDCFIDHGDQAQLLASVGLDTAGILASIKSRIETNS